MKSRIRNSWLPLCGCIALLIGNGCGEKMDQAEAFPEEQADGAYVQSVRNIPGVRITAKYLPPQFLAATERSRGNTDMSIDSLSSLYRQSLSFLVTVKTRHSVDNSEQSDPSAMPVALLSDDLNACFWIEVHDTVYPCAIAQLEHQDGNQCRYMTVFAVNAPQAFAEKDTVTLVFADPRNSSGGGIHHFRYAAQDILRTSDVITQAIQ